VPATLLAFLLFTATVDPRPAEPLRLLAEVGARDTTGGHLGLGLTRPHWVADATLAPRHGRARGVGLGEDPDLGPRAHAADVGLLADDDVVQTLHRN
jgi:hypothetical protein